MAADGEEVIEVYPSFRFGVFIIGKNIGQTQSIYVNNVFTPEVFSVFNSYGN